MQNQINSDAQITSVKAGRLSNITLDSDGETSQSNSSSEIIFQLHQPRFHLFQNKIDQPQVSWKLHQRAIKWLQTNCWTRQMSIESAFLSIALYYLYRSHLEIKKSKLQLILGTCVYLSSKMLKSPLLEYNSFIEMTSARYTTQQFLEEELKLLQIVDFNLNFQFTITSCPSLHFSPEFYHKLCFFIDILLIQDATILINRTLFNSLCSAIKASKLDPNLKKFLKGKNLEILVHKYNSKFEVQNYLQSFDML